jgi:4-hydroxy-2-oxoheptanedioate aldolase
LNDNVVCAMQVETADCIKDRRNRDGSRRGHPVPVRMTSACRWLYEEYKFPDMPPPELNDATNKLVAAAKKNNLICGVFLFGSSRVGEFLERGFPFQSLGNDLHHVLTQSGAYVNDIEKVSKEKGKPWTRRPTAFF